MVDQVKATPKTNPFVVHISVEESRTENVALVVNHIKEKQLKRTQFVSLSTSENDLDSGDHIIALVYRKNT